MHTQAILLIDDNPDDISLIVHAFRKSNITTEILIAHDGVEAVDLLLPIDHSEALRPAIVLLDLHLPKMGGFEVLARIRAEPSTRSLPVIILTTAEERDPHETPPTPDDAHNGFLQKPVQPGEFLLAAESLGVHWPGGDSRHSP